MKRKFFLICWVLVFCIAGFSQQEIKLSDINKPGENGIVEQQGIVLAENLLGPHKVVFSGNSPGSVIPVLSKEEQGTSGVKNFDKLAVLFSGKIYSPNMAEPILFENKTPEELVLLEIPVFPTILEQPYAVYLDLEIQARSKAVSEKLSDDNGIYQAVLNVSLIKI
ncbi:MAG: hypothetical protein WCC06_12100 [Candidatus Aminicenantales bacterium]